MSESTVEKEAEMLSAEAVRQIFGISPSTGPEEVPYDDEAYLRQKMMPFRASLALSPDGQWIALVLRGFVTGDDADEDRK
ncbi:MAG: hypothetical protein KY445_08015, partial [Armatimonadetes bacterium]|nr:hypothetical protein [Armatimonadota bacterium]